MFQDFFSDSANLQITKFATYTNFPSVGDINLLYYDESTNTFYVWDGSAYVKGEQYLQANTYSALPDATTRTNQIWVVLTTDGGYNAGFYISNGTTWVVFSSFIDDISGNVDTHAELPDATTTNGEVWLVKTTTGTLWTKKYAGFYVSNGTIWTPILNLTGLNAADIVFTPVGDIVGGDVAEALQELDQKKEPITNKENTTLDTSITKYPTNRLVKEYTDAKVANAISDGITTIAPSQNAVFDALALKEATSNKDASGGYVGLTSLKINFKNTLNTFTSFFTNSNTATRTYTFQNRDGVIVDDTDLATKEDAFIKNTAFNKNFGTSATEVCVGNDARLSDARQCNDTFNDATASKTALGLNNVNNTSDANKPVSTAQQTALDTKFGKATSAEISALTNKATPVGNDNLLGEDSANSNSKIRVLMSSVWNASNISSGTINVARLPNISYSKLFTHYQSSATATTTTSATPVIIAQVASVVVAEGGLVELFGFGDMNPDDAGSWCSTYLYRDSTLVGKFYTSQGSAASENDCFALGHYDAPGAGTYTYSIKTAVGYGTCTFGEGGDGNAPTLMIKVYHP